MPEKGTSSRPPRVLVTAFGPFDAWTENASWLCLVELTRELPPGADVTTRRYPVDYAEAKSLLSRDLEQHYDYAIHLGQAAGIATLHLEAVALNVWSPPQAEHGSHEPLDPAGPLAHESNLPIDRWAVALPSVGVPATVSYHAGTYLCNAVLYWNRQMCTAHNWSTRSCLVHVPLAFEQASQMKSESPLLSSSVAAAGLRWIIERLPEL